jgi:hypothetical protein
MVRSFLFAVQSVFRLISFWDLSVASLKILSRYFRYSLKVGQGRGGNRPDLPGFKNLAGLSPADLVGRVEHFDSTSVPGLSAQPIVDILVEVSSLERTNKEMAPVLERRGFSSRSLPNAKEEVQNENHHH